MEDTTQDFLSDPGTGGKSFGEPTTLKYPTSDQAESDPAGEGNKVTKVGFTVPMSWEALLGNVPKGHSEPVGNKYTQWLAWWFGKQVFRFWQFTESRLRKFRHFEGVWGHEWEEAEYREFKQKTRRVEDDEQSA